MTEFEYECLPFRQNPMAPTLCVFHAPASDVLKWAAIERLVDKPRAPQRRLEQYKVTAIERFLKRPENCIPTAVTVAVRSSGNALLAPATDDAWNADTHGALARLRLSVPEGTVDADKPAVVIDGQHRLVGVSKLDESMHVTVVALHQAVDEEIAFQFLVINNKSSKVSTDHIRSLASEYDKDRLEDRLRTARLTQYPNLEFVALADTDDESPFRGLMRWPSNRAGKQVVPPSAIESAIAAIQQKDVEALRDIEALCAFFFSMWRVVQREWSDLWAEACDDSALPPRKRLLDKIGIVCLTQYFADALVQLADLDRLDLTDLVAVTDTVAEMLAFQSKELWQSEWVSASYDTKAGRALVVDALVRVGRNLRKGLPWYDEVSVIDPGSIHP